MRLIVATLPPLPMQQIDIAIERRFGLPVGVSQSIVCLPVHAFWARWESIRKPGIAAQLFPHAMASRPGQLGEPFVLAGVDRTVALTASKADAAIKHAATVLAGRTGYPAAQTAKGLFSEIEDKGFSNLLLVAIASDGIFKLHLTWAQ